MQIPKKGIPRARASAGRLLEPAAAQGVGAGAEGADAGQDDSGGTRGVVRVGHQSGVGSQVDEGLSAERRLPMP